MTRYVAFLRGINVGGHKVIKMEELRKTFESLGFNNVKTLLASGNVLFETSKAGTGLVKKIEEKLKKTFGYDIGIILRTMKEIQNLADTNPFKKVPVTAFTRIYITFVSEMPTSNLKIPYELPEKDFKIIRVSSGEICSVRTLSPNQQTTNLMSFLEKEFGKKVTTRNWNTIIRILKTGN